MPRAHALILLERHCYVRLRHREHDHEAFACASLFWAQVLIGLVVGVVLGFLARTFALGWLTETLNTVGTIFVRNYCASSSSRWSSPL
ncbi:hypothetical protein [Propioniciclava flava]